MVKNLNWQEAWWPAGYINKHGQGLEKQPQLAVRAELLEAWVTLTIG